MSSSTYKSALPKLLFASDWQRLNNLSISEELLIDLVPLPPPPAIAFSIIPLPRGSVLKNALADSTVTGPSNPSGIGTSASFAANLARPLSPNSSRVSIFGPINTIPSFWHLLANSAFSAKNPYPGCIESAPDFLAILIMLSISK